MEKSAQVDYEERYRRYRTLMFAPQNTCRYVEVTRSSVGGRDHFEIKEGDPATTDPSAWLARRDGFSNGLQLLLGSCDFNKNESRLILPLRDDTFNSIKYALGLPKQIETCLTDSTGQFSRFSRNGPEGEDLECTIFKVGIGQPGYYALFLSYDASTCTSTGLVLSKGEDPDFDGLIEQLKIMQHCCAHPYFAVFALMELVISSYSRSITLENWKHNDILEWTGQHNYKDRQRGDPLRRTETGEFEFDFEKATRDLNGASEVLVVNRMRVGQVITSLKRIQEVMKEKKPQGEDGDGGEALRRVGRELDEQAAYLVNICDNLTLRAEHLHKRMQTQLLAVYNFIGQRDNLLNQEIADAARSNSENMRLITEATQKDGSAVKGIAILGMGFLPATFVATFFSMPLFDWTVSEGQSIVRDRFGWYWVVAIPLTLLVITSWWVVTLWGRYCADFWRQKVKSLGSIFQKPEQAREGSKV